MYNSGTYILTSPDVFDSFMQLFTVHTHPRLVIIRAIIIITIVTITITLIIAITLFITITLIAILTIIFIFFIIITIIIIGMKGLCNAGWQSPQY